MKHEAKRVSFTGGVTSMLVTQGILILFHAANGVITARLLGPDGKGVYTLCLLIPSICYLLLTLNLQGSLTYLAGRNEYSPSALFSFSIFTTLVISLLPAIALFLLPTSLLNLIVPGFPSELWTIVVILFPLIMFSNFLSGLLLGWQMIGEMNLMRIIQSAASVLLALALLLSICKTPQVAAISYVLALVLSIGYVFFQLYRNKVSLVTNIPTTLAKRSTEYGIKGYAGNLFQFFNYRFDVFLVNYFLNPAQVGLYSVAVSLAELLWHLPNSIASMLFSKVAREHGGYSLAKVEIIFRLTWVMVVLGIIAFVLTSRQLITLLFGTAYAGSFSPLLWLLPGVFFLSMSKIMTGYFNGTGHPQYGSLSSVISFVVTIIADIVLIPRYGIDGAAIASSLSYMCATLVVLYYFLKNTQASYRSLFSINRTDFDLVCDMARTLCRR